MAKDDIEDKLDQLVADGKKPAPKKPETKIVSAVHSFELSEAEKVEIEAEAAAEVAKELKAEKRKEFKLAAKQKLKKQVLFRHGKDEEGENTELVLVTLAPHMPYIRLDNDLYYPNRAYRLSVGKAQVLREQMFRGDLHDNEIHGKKMSEFYGHRPQGLTIGPNSPLPSGVAH